MLEVKHLTYQVMENGAERKLVDDVSFSVKDGEMLVITGPNGGGKSTIAKLLMGIEKADEGEILLDGQDLSHMNVDGRANAGIGYAFQQPPSFKGMTVEAIGKDDQGNDAAFFYRDNNSGQEGDDLYFNVSLNGKTYTFTVESYLCDKDTDVYKAVKNLKIGDKIDMEGFLYWYNGVNPHITSVKASK